MEVILSTRNIVEIAQETLQRGSIVCEWQGCQVQLHSWKGLQEHLGTHLHQFKPQDNVYDCRFQRCAGRFQASLHELTVHVDLSHLSRVHLPCPIEGCPERFGRHALLPGHMLEAHTGLLGKKIPYKSGILKPPRKPFRRRYQDLPEPSPSVIPTHMLLTRPVCRAHRRHENKPDGIIAHVSRKWSRMTAAENALPEDHAEHAEPLGALPVRTACPSDYSVRRKPPEEMWQLSRPQPLYDPPVPEHPLPVSIGYAPFKAKYEVLEQAGLIDGSGVWVSAQVDVDDPAEE